MISSSGQSGNANDQGTCETRAHLLLRSSRVARSTVSSKSYQNAWLYCNSVINSVVRLRAIGHPLPTPSLGGVCPGNFKLSTGHACSDRSAIHEACDEPPHRIMVQHLKELACPRQCACAALELCESGFLFLAWPKSEHQRMKDFIHCHHPNIRCRFQFPRR